MSFSPIVSIMAASVALSASRYSSYSSSYSSSSRRRRAYTSSRPQVVRTLTPAEMAADKATAIEHAKKRKRLERKARFQGWMRRYREGNMKNSEFQHHLQYDKGFLEHVEHALKLKGYV